MAARPGASRGPASADRPANSKWRSRVYGQWERFDHVKGQKKTAIACGRVGTLLKYRNTWRDRSPINYASNVTIPEEGFPIFDPLMVRHLSDMGTRMVRGVNLVTGSDLRRLIT